ncbi:MAG: monovalent cation/H+ antiporter complex subunit F [Actinomycetota bacterium]|nr:monovalent cation/H+ antiporter complex subunit F [Actinomycetota bacterium]
MTTFFLVASLIIVANAFICLYRAVKGPTLPDRILAVNVVGSKTLVVLVLIAYVFGQSMYLDTAFIYGLLLFVVTVATARYLETGGLIGV